VHTSASRNGAALRSILQCAEGGVALLGWTERGCLRLPRFADAGEAEIPGVQLGEVGDSFNLDEGVNSQMSEFESPQTQAAKSEASAPRAKVPLTARLLLRESVTARRAAAIIAAFTLIITIAGGILERVFDRQEFPTIGRGLWFALQTVTTVGYGDVTPRHADGRFIGAVVMLTGIGFLAVITASVTASLIESSRRRFAESEVEMARQLQEVSERLVRIEAALSPATPSEASDGLG
jgi:voltage-gated potassium channel